MSEWDELFQPQAFPTDQREQPFDKEAWAQKKQELRQWTYETIDATTAAIAQNGEQFQHYLDVQSRFDLHSVSNALLILAQRPDATRIADFDAWKEQGVFIRRKETGFYILEPGEEYKREDGSTGVSYNPKKMFDVSQTTAPKKEPPTLPDDRTRIKALTDRSPVPITIGDALPAEVHALYQPDTRNILVRRGLGAGDIFRALAQELAHAEMDRGHNNYSRSSYNFQAYCAAYMLSKKFGVETASFRFGRVNERLKELEPQQIRAELSVMKDATHNISRRMHRVLAEQRQQQPNRSDSAR
ncbi:hypothetical protein SAMN05880570_4015 [Paenibacillus sp. RU4T]|uniref:hypothetical protein n=1 Tax=unclassified Paenibacillus TaxID=185978 RepID=UPI000954BDEF|nr:MULTISPECIES: hypothetical protein [unclassified Paenibacillus]SIR50187.1 hypothetical protein SAMN05880555_4012 [Paenibacillus sp. RU4X]SIR59236.1 hypothetical protein SAMN05880570_4015 [Paenibacillus sp. RU4T]